jgi:multiple sugar transport system ATP-binding protein
MVREPKAFLMDEPLSNLDAKLRVQMRAELARLHERLRTTTVYVTHDQVEAITLGDRVAVLEGGVLQQVDTPQRLFDEPANLFVATFIGSPSMNLVEAAYASGRLSFAGFTMPIPAGRDLALYEGRDVIVGVRPSDFEDASLGHQQGLPVVEVVPEVVEILGTETHVIFEVDAPPVQVGAIVGTEAEEGDEVIAPLTAGRTTFTASVSHRSRVQAREPISLTVDTARLHFFDPSTGAAIPARTATPAAAAPTGP